MRLVFVGLSNEVHQRPVHPLDGTTVLASEQQPAHAYAHLERTFSEFMLSDYGQPGGAAGVGPYAPGQFSTSNPDNAIARCQDCHMRDVNGVGCNKKGVPSRPDDSTEHPQSGQPLHDLTGGNIFVAAVLASTVAGSPNYDATNAQPLGRGPDVLTLDLTQGEGLDANALLDGVERAKQQLQLAAAFNETQYDAASGTLSFKRQNQTGHKLLSGFPEGRRMWVNVKAYTGGSLVHEVNPYDEQVGTLKGLPAETSPSSPALAPHERHVDELVYEIHPASGLSNETETFHMALADRRYKDNRIPPKGFRIGQSPARLAQPVWHGQDAQSYFGAEEYAGGYDAVTLALPAGADRVEVALYYQVTSREFVEFLRDEIKGPPSRTTLPSEAYIAQTDGFFSRLKAWGDTIWSLWTHNKSLAGAAPFLMASAAIGSPSGCTAPAPQLLEAVAGQKQVSLQWSNVQSGDADVVGYSIYYDTQEVRFLYTGRRCCRICACQRPRCHRQGAVASAPADHAAHNRSAQSTAAAGLRLRPPCR